MSLFVCMNPDCQCVENTNLVSKNIGSNDNYPNMHLMDMQGHGDEIIYSGESFLKHPEDILMLCAFCNTGVHHNEFPREKASEESLKLAKISKYNAITPMDHPDGSIVKNENSEWGNADEYRLATPDEMTEYVNIRKQGKSALTKIFGLAASLGIDLPSLTSSNKVDQSPSEKKRKMLFAEYRRQWKQAKKDKDMEKVKRFKSKMDSLK